ncbi:MULTISPECIES: glycosyltransferase [unclassified Leucobacter]|uniref:glycosyltransferase n=1 Tax=unclassified Leucobacter TaxID=2621730 RepID=UPI00165D46BA|nr:MULTISPECIES: glycosyltransferase [unclassified Leucobacter]MBC9936606.1 glycosyltransferase [Leucobacter sp. cx-87]
MHILFLPSWYPETADDFSGSFFREQAEAFVDEGHQVGVLSVRGFPLYAAREMRARPSGVRIAEEAGIPVYRADVLLPVPKWAALNLRALERHWQTLYERYVSAHGVPDVLHAHAMFPAGIVAHRIATREGIPFVVTEHRPSSMDRLREPGLGKMAIRAAGSTRGLVAVARGFATELNAAYASSSGETWRYLPGLLSPQFEDVRVREFPAGEMVFGHVSHLDPGKRVGLLIDSFAEAFPGATGPRLRIIGNSVHLQGLKQQASERGVGSRVEFVGAIPREQIAAEFGRLHVFVLPSEAEAFGTVLWEAMACGVPLVSTRTWAGLNAVTEQTGLTVAIDNQHELAEALITMQQTAVSYDGEQIRNHSVSHCGRAAFVANYIELYREVGA